LLTHRFRQIPPGASRAWLDMAKQFEGQILTPFDMTMGIMSIYICAAIAYNLANTMLSRIS
jgi:cellobiose-specific phosphotransferase system component IIC